MARKRRLFFDSVFTLLSARRTSPIYRRFRRLTYGAIACATVLLCLSFSPSLAGLSPHPGSMAQTALESTAEAQQLEQTARAQYAAGEFDLAADLFQRLAERYQAQGDTLKQAISLSNVSLAQQQVGAWPNAVQSISASLNLLETEQPLNQSPDHQSAYAQALDIRAKLELSQGRSNEAIATWEQAAAIHTRLGHGQQAMESQINQARALQRLGLHTQSIALLQAALRSQNPDPLLLLDLKDLPAAEASAQLNQWLQTLSPSPLTIAALQGLGESLQVVSSLDQAQAILLHSLELAKTLALPDAIAAANLSLGNVSQAQAIASLRLDNLTVEQALAQRQKPLSTIQQTLQYRQINASQQFHQGTDAALEYYQQAANGSSPSLVETQAQLNRLNVLLDRQQWAEAATALAQVSPSLDRLPPSQSAIDAHINLAQSLMRLAKSGSAPALTLHRQAAQQLATAYRQATDLGNVQAESYALGTLGELYEHTHQWADAETMTQQALAKINPASVTNLPLAINDADLAYRWQYQLGRIRQTQQDRDGAIAAYGEAIKMLQTLLRLDVASSNLSYKFTFQDIQQPVHQALIDILLKEENPDQNDLQRVREVSSSLLEAQLTSFLQAPCQVVTPKEVDTIVQETGQKAAIVYPILLPDRLEVVVKLPGVTGLYHYRYAVPEQEILAQLSNLQVALEEEYTFEAVKSLSKQFYDRLIKPLEFQLAAHQVDTLIFALDRQLQTIPMAALYDGEHYLIERYAISEILGLRLTNSKTSLQPEDLKVIGAGLANIPSTLAKEIRDSFSPLNYVETEMTALKNSGMRTVTLVNQDFTLTNFNNRLNEEKFPVVHLATHGQFSLDPQKTFLLAAQDPFNDGLISMNDLGALFRVRGRDRQDPIELLVLNACETASGDDLATLGIAGTAVRAGARSAIASLWTLEDAPSVRFTETLYANLQQPNVSKAEALQKAQLALLQDPLYRHPRYWSPYILAGNWLPLTTSRSMSSAGATRAS